MSVVHHYMGVVAEAAREYRELASSRATLQQYAARELRALRLARFWANQGHTVSVASERFQ
jgi:hypothetical protein